MFSCEYKTQTIDFEPLKCGILSAFISISLFSPTFAVSVQFPCCPQPFSKQLAQRWLGTGKGCWLWLLPFSAAVMSSGLRGRSPSLVQFPLLPKFCLRHRPGTCHRPVWPPCQQSGVAAVTGKHRKSCGSENKRLDILRLEPNFSGAFAKK